MAKQAHADVLDGGLLALKNNAIRILLISAYAPGDSYATVVANKLAEVTVAPADLVIAADGSNRKLTSAAKTGNATATIAAGSDLHFAFTDNVGKVLYVTDETTNMAITSGNPVNFPALVYTAVQPV